MLWYRNLRMVPKIVFPVGLVLTIALGVLTWQVQSKSSAAIGSLAERALSSLAGEHGNAVKSFIEIPLNLGGALASAFGKSVEDNAPLSRESMIKAVRGVQRDNKDIVATGIGCEPDGIDSDSAFIGTPGSDEKTGRFLPYIVSGAPKLEVLEGMADSDWYQLPKKTLNAFLTDPYLYSVGNNKILMTTASSPIVADRKFLGMVGVDISLEKIGEIVSKIKVYDSGWAAVVSGNGIVTAYKDPDLLTKDLFRTKLVGNASGLRTAMGRGESFIDTHSTDGVDSFCYYYPIHLQATGQTWYFVVSAPIDEVLAEANAISRLTIIISLAALVLSLLVILLVVRTSVKPLGILAVGAKKIADGDLHFSIDDSSFGGEVHDLGVSLKEMIASLVVNIDKAEQMSLDAQAQTAKAQEAVREAEKSRAEAESAKREGMLAAAGQLESIAGIISSASADLSLQIERSEQGSADQAARVSETATAMEEMNTTVLEVARSAGLASEMSGNAKAKAQEGAVIVRQAVTGIQNVQGVSMALKEDMNKLAEQANAISNIMSVISDIADQTNLLALNAAIEAARAGDAGRGFAVVADEVRKLAEKTMLATRDVGNTITSIQGSVNQSIHQVDKAVELVGIATEQSNKSGAALHEIVGMVDAAADQVRSIATASEEQSSTSEEINRSVSDVNSIAEQTAHAMHNAAKAVSSLATQANTLTKLIQDMKNQ